MARTFAIAAVLLGVLPGGFANGVSSHICSEMPYVLLRDYEPAKEWCSSPHRHAVPKPPAHHMDGDIRHRIFSELLVAPQNICSAYCSCIKKSTTTSSHTSTQTTGTLKTSSTSATGCSNTIVTTTATTSITVTTTLPADTITLPANTITLPAVTTTITLPADTVTLPANTITLPADTITLPPITTTVTATITITASPSTTTTPSAGPPTCTPATNPPGTCAHLASYNSGTTPQLWAGPASSLTACALLCAGEPTCLSLAYAPGTALPCVLFSTAFAGLSTTANPSSSTSFYDATCFGCSGAAPRPPTDDGCSPALQPPAGATCNQAGIWAGGTINVLSAPGNTAVTAGACEQQCLAVAGCASFGFDGASCMLFSISAIQLVLEGFLFPVNPGVAGSTVVSDKSCFVCPALGCSCPPPVSRREVARREADLARREADVRSREAELARRMAAVAEWEREIAKHRGL